MKHLSGEKTGLKAGLLINSCIFIFLLFSSIINCQIPINGFCTLKSIQVPKGFQSLIPADINFDGDDELICYSSTLKRIGLLSNNSDHNFELKEFLLNSELSQLKPLGDKYQKAKYLIAIERKQRKISLHTLSPDMLNQNIAEITFDSYPEKIQTADIDLDGIEEILVSGSGFDGLSILSRSESNFGEKKIITETSFSDAIFIDLNDDMYPDVLAFNILENSLQYYLNNTNGEFRLNRSDRYPARINLLQAVDINLDGIKDIVYSVNDNLEILCGDLQSSYERKKTIWLDMIPSGIQFGDFNNDEIIDIACIEYQNKINVFFGKEDSTFYEGITYLQNSSLINFSKFQNQNSENIACLFESGEINTIATVSEIQSDIRIVPSIKSGTVKKFDYAEDDVPDISYIDEYDNSLKLFLNDERGIPQEFYSFPLVDSHKEILVDEFFKRRKIFYCYTKGSPLLEVLRYNFYTNKLYRKQLYAPGEILDVALQRMDSTVVNVFLVYNKNSKLYLGKFENRDLSVTFREYPPIDRNVNLAGLLVNENPEIYYWKSEGDSLQFKSVEIISGPNINKTHFEISESDSLKVDLYRSDTYYNDYPSLVSFVQLKTDNYMLVLSGNKISVSKNIINPSAKKIKKFDRGYFGGTSVKGINNFTVNTEDDFYIYKLVFSDKARSFTLRRMLDAENVSDYFFARLDKKNYYMIYSNKKEGYLSILPLKK